MSDFKLGVTLVLILVLAWAIPWLELVPALARAVFWKCALQLLRVGMWWLRWRNAARRRRTERLRVKIESHLKQKAGHA